MKKLGLLAMPLMAISLLVNCGNGGNKYDDNCQYLTFNAEGDSSVKYIINGSVPNIKMEYSADMKTWTPWESERPVAIEKGKKIYIKNDSEHLSIDTSNYVQFVMYGRIAASGKISSLNNSDVLHDCEYINLFNKCYTLVRAPALPATTLASRCYKSMFESCYSLSEAPELPATTLANYCYYDMFYYCYSLKRAPKLPATTLENGCYYDMFSDCYSLTEAPDLPATTLTDCCYQYMFYNCYNLIKAPKLPATTLTDCCYNCMFYKCFNLKEAPELPATNLMNRCYEGMFFDCINLKEIKVGFGTPESESWPEPNSCTENWLQGAGVNTDKPTFVWKGKTSDFSQGWRSNSTIPEGWAIKTY